MKNLSVSQRFTGHLHELFDTIFSKNSGKRGVIVGYAGLEGAESYMVKFDDDPGYAASMPFRYIPVNEVSSEEVPLSMNVNGILEKLTSGEHLLNREIDFLVQNGVAEYTYNDPESNGPDGFRIRSGRTGDGDPYLDQVGIEERVRL